MDKINLVIEELKKTNDKDQIIDLCYSIKSIISENVKNYKLLINDEMIPFLKLGLGDNVDSEVTVTILKLLQLPLKVEPKETLEFIFKNGILDELFNKLTVSSISTSQAANDLLIKIISLHQYNDFILFSEWFKNKFNQLLLKYTTSTSTDSGGSSSGSSSSNDKIILFRIIDVGLNLLSFNKIQEYFKLSSESDESLELYTNKLFEKFKEPFVSSLIQVFNQAIKQDDIMTEMNLIESLEELCKFARGIETIQEKGFFKSISTLLNNSTNPQYQDELLSSTPVLNKAIAFIANISSKSNENAELLFKDYNYLQVLEYHLDHSEEYLSRKLKIAILSSIGIIGLNSKGLDQLNKNTHLMKLYAEYLASSDQETIITIYDSFSIMLKSIEKIHLVSDKLYQIYNQIPSDLLLSKLSKNYQSPIQEVKNSSLAFIQALCLHSWSADAILRMPGFFEYLMNRSNESTKLSKEWKFFIVQTLVNNHKDLFNVDPEWRDRYHQMQSYIKKGVHFIPYESAIKVEDEHL